MSLSLKSSRYTPQALSTGISSRIAKDADSAIIHTQIPQERSAKRNAQQINYAEFDVNEDFDVEDPNKEKNVASFPSANVQALVLVQKHLLKPARFTKSLPEDSDSSDVGPEVLVPLKLNIEYNGGTSKLIDFFMWNVNDKSVSPEQFASTIVTDLDLPNQIQLDIAESIQKQIDDLAPAAAISLPSEGQFFVILDVSVNLSKRLFEDKFEWDLSQTEVSAEDFAGIVVADMGLSLEFKPAIAHCMHEITLRLRREIAEGSYNHELHKYQQIAGLIFERSIRIRTDSSVNNGNAIWEPIIETLSPWEIEKREIERERNTRRLKRENMRREVDDLMSTKRRATVRRRADDLDWKF